MIRELREADIDALFAILERARAESSVPIGPRWTREQFGEECATLGLVAEISGSAAAFVLYRDVGEAFEISMLATDPRHVRRGAMKSLLLEFFNRRTPPKPVWLEVHEANLPARSMYEKLGFVTVGKRPRYYSDGGAAILYNYG